MVNNGGWGFAGFRDSCSFMAIHHGRGGSGQEVIRMQNIPQELRLKIE